MVILMCGRPILFHPANLRGIAASMRRPHTRGDAGTMGHHTFATPPGDRSRLFQFRDATARADRHQGARMFRVGATRLVLLAALAACEAPQLRDAVEIPHGLQTGRSTAYVDLGPADDGIALRALVAMPVRDTAALDATIDAIYDPANPAFRQYLSLDDWQQRHAPVRADVDVVV